MLQFRGWPIVILYLVSLIFDQRSSGAVSEGTNEAASQTVRSKETDVSRDLQVRLFTRYQKGALTFGHADATKNDVLVIYPAAVPAVGVAFQWRKIFTAAWSVNMPKTSFIDDRLRGSRLRHLEAHSTPGPFNLDAHYLRYEGLFAAKEAKIDIRPFQDSLFKGNRGANAYPDLVMESFGIGAIFNFDDDRVKFSALLNQSKHPGQTGWARCLVSQVREARFKSNHSIDSRDLDHSSGRMQAMALGPGIAAQYVEGDRFIGGVGSIAPAYSRSELSGQSRHEGFATFLSARGSMGINDGARAWGLSGNKSLLTIDRRDVSMTESVSSVELFYMANF